MENTADRNKSIVLRHFAALDTGDYAELDQIHAPDGRNHAPAPFDLSEWPEEGRAFGPGEVRATFEWLRTAAPDLHVVVEQLVAEGDQVDAWVRMTGTQTGPMGAIPPTGRRTDARHVHRFRIRDDRITEHWAIRDDLRAMLEAGLVAPPGGRP